MRFEEPGAFLLLLLVPVVWALYWWSKERRNRRLARAGDEPLITSLVPTGPGPGTRPTLLSLVFVLLVCALARPQLGSRLQVRPGRGMDIVFALDLSRSMGAKDAVPSRLQRLKIELKELIDALKGDRIGLVGFTSVAVPLTPLTVDHRVVELQLESTRVTDLPRGGTSLAAALISSKRLLDSARSTDGSKAIVLVTDGEDHIQDPTRIASELAAIGIAVHVIGIGTAAGDPIPVFKKGRPAGFQKDKNGQTIISQLNTQLLAKIARRSGGIVALPNEAGAPDLTGIRSHLLSLKRADLKGREVRIYEERFQWFLFAAIGLLMLELLLHRRRAIAVMLLVCLPSGAHAGPFDSEDKDNARGTQALLEKNSSAAIDAYASALKRHQKNPSLMYNLGLAYAQSGDAHSAVAQYRWVINNAKDDELKAKAAFALGNVSLKLGRLEDSAFAYRRAILLDSKLADAKKNLELVLRLQERPNPNPKEPSKGPGIPSSDPGPAPTSQKADAGVSRDGGTPDGGQPNPDERSQGQVTEQDLDQILDALAKQEKALKRRRLFRKLGKGRVEKDW